MKNIPSQNQFQTLIEKCRRNDTQAQADLYKHFKNKMFVVCLRYANSREDAEDFLQEGFIKVFRDLNQYKGAGSFEGWVRKVIVNATLEHLRKQKNRPLRIGLDGIEFKLAEETPIFEDENQAKTLIKLMQKMPTGFRTVLNLYILEGYTHPEIASILDISVGTSKSQLMRAKACLKKLLEESLTS